MNIYPYLWIAIHVFEYLSLIQTIQIVNKHCAMNGFETDLKIDSGILRTSKVNIELYQHHFLLNRENVIEFFGVFDRYSKT